MKNKVTVEIYGARYPITTNEDPTYVSKLAEEIDSNIRTLLGPGSGISLHEATILLCMNYLDGSIKAEQGADRLREQVAEYLEESAKANMELAEARAEIERLSRELEQRSDHKAD